MNFAPGGGVPDAGEDRRRGGLEGAQVAPPRRGDAVRDLWQGGREEGPATVWLLAWEGVCGSCISIECMHTWARRGGRGGHPPLLASKNISPPLEPKIRYLQNITGQERGKLQFFDLLPRGRERVERNMLLWQFFTKLFRHLGYPLPSTDRKSNTPQPVFPPFLRIPLVSLLITCSPHLCC